MSRPVCETNFQGELSTNYSGTYGGSHGASAAGGLAAKPKIFVFVTYYRSDFLLELMFDTSCTHFEAAKVMTVASVT